MSFRHASRNSTIPKTRPMAVGFTVLLLSQAAWAIKFIANPSPANKCVGLFGNFETKIYDSENKQVEFENFGDEVFRQSVRSRGPFQQPMAAFVTNGLPTVFGTKKAMERLRYDFGMLRDVVFDFTLFKGKDQYQYRKNGEEVDISIVPALTGSSLNSRRFSDLDAEILLVTSSRGFQLEQFYDPKSPTIKALEEYLREHIKDNESKGYIFSDFKAGEYDFVPASAESTKSRAIKWTKEEITRGYKMIPTGSDKGKKRKLTLAEAIATQSRIKVDWVAKIETDRDFAEATGVKDRYIELSVLMMLAGSRPGGTPVLKINEQTEFPSVGATGAHMGIQGTSSHLPVRITAAFFDAKHVELARQASVATPPPDIRYLNTVILNAAKTYFKKRDYLKILRVLSTRLFYWNDFMYFRHEYSQRKISSTSSEMYKTMTEIIESNTVMDLKILLEVGKGIELYQQATGRGQNSSKRYYKAINKYMRNNGLIKKSIEFNSIEDAISFVKDQMGNHVMERINNEPDLKSYIDFVLAHEYANSYDYFSAKSTFVSYKMPSGVQNSYEPLVSQWQSKYPHLTFSRPNDLHMTLAFLGEVPQGKLRDVETLVAEYSQRLQRYPFEFTDGVLRIVGRNNSQVAVVFPEHQLPAGAREALADFRADLHRLGLKPDDHGIFELLPHVSVAHVRNAYFSSEGHLEISRLLMEDTPGMSRIEIKGEMKAQIVEDLPETAQQSDRYLEYRPEILENTDLSPSDFQ